MPERTEASGISDLAILNGITRQRQTSNYFFIAINILMVSVDLALSTYCLSYPAGSTLRYFGIATSAAFGFTALPLAVYWRRELREFDLLQQTMYQALMDEERIYSDRGTLSKFWDRIGDIPGRSSAVFSTRGALMLPYLLASLQAVPIYANVMLLMYHPQASVEEIVPARVPALPTDDSIGSPTRSHAKE